MNEETLEPSWSHFNYLAVYWWWAFCCLKFQWSSWNHTGLQRVWGSTSLSNCCLVSEKQGAPSDPAQWLHPLVPVQVLGHLPNWMWLSDRLSYLHKSSTSFQFARQNTHYLHLLNMTVFAVPLSMWTSRTFFLRSTLCPLQFLQRSFELNFSPCPWQSGHMLWICWIMPGPICCTLTCTPLPLQFEHFSMVPFLPP